MLERKRTLVMMPHMKWISFLMWAALLFLVGCAKDDIAVSSAPQADYEHAQELVNMKSYARATLFLEKFSSKHPYSEYAVKAELLRLYAAYKDEEYILSETLATRFIERHPRHPDLAYVQYMLGLSFVKESTDSARDQTATHHAIEAFELLLTRYPASAYVQESRVYLQKMQNKLAKHELYVGKFYYEHERYVAAVNRFQVVLKDYQTSPAIEESLYYLAESYAKLNLMKNAQETAELLQHNYPKGGWSEKAARFL